MASWNVESNWRKIWGFALINLPLIFPFFFQFIFWFAPVELTPYKVFFYLLLVVWGPAIIFLDFVLDLHLIEWKYKRVFLLLGVEQIMLDVVTGGMLMLLPGSLRHQSRLSA